jgi:peroxiredoxin
MPIRRLTLVAALSAAAIAAHAATPGEPAPVFTVNDAAGKAVALSDYRGKYVVLEWTNPECPFVQKHYKSRNMQSLQKDAAGRGLVWLSVNSTVKGHPEYKSGAQMTAWMNANDAAPRAVLIDDTSATGRAYSAKTTPQMFLIDPSGKLLYAGAIDDKRSTNVEDVKTARNHVRAAIDEALAGKPVTVASTAPYGCSVKY